MYVSGAALDGVQGGFNPFPIAFDTAYKTANGMAGNTGPENQRTLLGDLNQARKNLAARK